MSDETLPYTKDIILPLEKTERGHRCLRMRGDEHGPKEVCMGEIIPVQEGESLPMTGEYIQSRQVGNHLEVESSYMSPEEEARRSEQIRSRVSNNAYRAGWDRIFGKPEKVSKVSKYDLN